MMKLLNKILTSLTPGKVVTRVYELHKNSSTATKIVGLGYVILLGVLLGKGLINADDFMNVILKIFRL